MKLFMILSSNFLNLSFSCVNASFLKFQILFMLSLSYITYQKLSILSKVFQLFFTKPDFGFVDSIVFFACLFVFWCFFWLHCTACRIRDLSQQGIGLNLGHLQWKSGALTTGPPGNSLSCFFIFNVIILLYYFLFFFLWIFSCSLSNCLS